MTTEQGTPQGVDIDKILGRGSQLSPDEILESVAKRFGITREEIFAPTSQRHITEARHFAMAALKGYHQEGGQGLGVSQIGEIFGLAPRTVFWGIRRGEEIARNLVEEKRDDRTLDEKVQEASVILNFLCEVDFETLRNKSLRRNFFPRVFAARMLSDRGVPVQKIAQLINLDPSNVWRYLSRGEEWFDRKEKEWNEDRQRRNRRAIEHAGVKNLTSLLKLDPEKRDQLYAVALEANQIFGDISLTKIRSGGASFEFTIPRIKLAKLLKNKGFDREEIAEILDRHPSTISEILAKDDDWLTKNIDKWNELRRVRERKRLKKRQINLGKEEQARELAEGQDKEKKEIERRNALLAKHTIQEVARDYLVDPDEMISKSRKKFLVQARNTAQFIMFQNSNMVYEKISLAVGRTDHTTAMHSIDKVRNRLEIDPEFKERVERLVVVINKLVEEGMRVNEVSG